MARGYGEAYQRKQLGKYRNRHSNHWKHRIRLAQDLVRRHAMPRLQGKPRHDIICVDVGCSIGTFSIEMAKSGYRSFGIDLDPEAIRIAEELSAEEGVSPRFLCADVAHWPRDLPPIDIAICFDVFEHLHDDELGDLLRSIRQHLSENGSLVFHTFPTAYEHLFHGNSKGMRWASVGLAPFALLGEPMFAKVTRLYSRLYDVVSLIRTGKTYRGRIRNDVHCNLLTAERLSALFDRAEFKVLEIASANLYPDPSWRGRWFSRHAVSHRNLYGVAIAGPQPDPTPNGRAR